MAKVIPVLIDGAAIFFEAESQKYGTEETGIGSEVVLQKWGGSDRVA
jgi:hypothetical protein